MAPTSKQLPSLEPADLWIQITQLPRPFRLVDFPRKGADGAPVGQLAMVVLTQEESMSASLSTERWVRKSLKDAASMPSNGEPAAGYNLLFEKREALELLFRCCKKPDNLEKSFFPALEQIAAKLTTDEIGVLLYNYIRVQAEIGPITATMSQDEVDRWIEHLVKGGSAFPLDSLSVGAQSSLVLSMANRLWDSQTGKCWRGAPPAEST